MNPSINVYGNLCKEPDCWPFNYKTFSYRRSQGWLNKGPRFAVWWTCMCQICWLSKITLIKSLEFKAAFLQFCPYERLFTAKVVHWHRSLVHWIQYCLSFDLGHISDYKISYTAWSRCKSIQCIDDMHVLLHEALPFYFFLSCNVCHRGDVSHNDFRSLCFSSPGFSWKKITPKLIFDLLYYCKYYS